MSAGFVRAVAIFEVADGYKAVISLDNALAPGGVIATRDLDAPRGPFMTWNDRPSAPGSASIQLAFRVPSAALEACHAELIAHGVAILREPPTSQPGATAQSSSATRQIIW